MKAIEIANAVRGGKASAIEIAEDAIRSAKEKERLGAFLFLDPEMVRARAKSVGKAGALAGVPIALKDALVTKGIPTTAGSKILEGWIPPYDGTAVARLLDAGAVILGKTNMDEFAMGSSNENSAYGPCKNPHDESRTPGGSSGGSAVAVAAGIAPLALGSDTGGSIRQPAALTGVVGVKPTYGRVSRYGLVAFASSLDQIGPFATNARDAARLLGVIAGRDARDATSLDAPIPDWEADCERGVRGLRLGVPEEYFGAGLDPEIELAVLETIARLEKAGCTVKSVKLPHTKHAVATYYVIATAEASSNLARFDGVRYGLRVPANDLKSMYGNTRSQGFGREVKRRILLGTFVLSAGYYDAYYLRAQKVRTLIRRDFDAAFADVDAIVSPTSPTPAFELGEKTDDPLAMYLSDVYTLPASLAGLPAASFPCGKTKTGLPIGFQAVARALDESTLFRIGAALE